MNDKTNEFVKKLNEKSYLQNIKVPILNGFTIVDNPNSIFTAVNDKNYIEQFLTDGIINESFEKHIEKVIEDTKKTMNDSNLEDVDKSFNFIEDYKNDYFDFKVYTQDIKITERIIRQFNIYFMDKDTEAFFEVTLCSAPYDIKDIDFVNGELTTNMKNTIHDLMNHIKKDTK